MFFTADRENFLLLGYLQWKTGRLQPHPSCNHMAWIWWLDWRYIPEGLHLTPPRINSLLMYSPILLPWLQFYTFFKEKDSTSILLWFWFQHIFCDYHPGDSTPHQEDCFLACPTLHQGSPRDRISTAICNFSLLLLKTKEGRLGSNELLWTL